MSASGMAASKGLAVGASDLIATVREAGAEKCAEAGNYLGAYNLLVLELMDLKKRLAAGVFLTREDLAQLQRTANRHPLEVDISDFGDEWCAGFLRGQTHALEVLAACLSEANGG